MGKLLKNPDLSPGTLAARLPIATGSLSDAPVNGLIRFNTTNNKVEFYYNNAWNQVAKIGSVAITVDTFTTSDAISGTGKQQYTMSQAESDNRAIAVFIGGVYQRPDGSTGVSGNYYVNGTPVITFTTAPPDPTGFSPNQIVVIHNLNSTDAV